MTVRNDIKAPVVRVVEILQILIDEIEEDYYTKKLKW